MMEWINSGGPLMWGILAGGLIVLIIFFERFFYLHKAQIEVGDFLEGIINNIERGNDLEAVTICDQTPGPVAHLVRTALLHRDDDRNTLLQAVREAGICQIPLMERRTNMLITLAQVLPMLGLLGTVLGLIGMLIALQTGSPLVEIGTLTGGLWVALLTTAAGLTTGIPAYAGYHFLVGRIETLAVDMEQAASQIVYYLTQSGKQDTGNES
jgi:biopolymer transport protein ExbB